MNDLPRHRPPTKDVFWGHGFDAPREVGAQANAQRRQAETTRAAIKLAAQRRKRWQAALQLRREAAEPAASLARPT